MTSFLSDDDTWAHGIRFSNLKTNPEDSRTHKFLSGDAEAMFGDFIQWSIIQAMSEAVDVKGNETIAAWLNNESSTLPNDPFLMTEAIKARVRLPVFGSPPKDWQTLVKDWPARVLQLLWRNQ